MGTHQTLRSAHHHHCGDLLHRSGWCAEPRGRAVCSCRSGPPVRLVWLERAVDRRRGRLHEGHVKMRAQAGVTTAEISSKFSRTETKTCPIRRLPVRYENTKTKIPE